MDVEDLQGGGEAISEVITQRLPVYDPKFQAKIQLMPDWITQMQNSICCSTRYKAPAVHDELICGVPLRRKSLQNSRKIAKHAN